MPKVKYNEETGLYKLKVTHPQLELLVKFCANTVLGSDDEHRNAAKQFLIMVEGQLGSQFVNDACDNIVLDAVIQNDDPIGGQDLAVIKNENISLRISTNPDYDA